MDIHHAHVQGAQTRKGRPQGLTSYKLEYTLIKHHQKIGLFILGIKMNLILDEAMNQGKPSQLHL